MQIKKFDSINVVPFIDIMLVLLVIVLTTATFVAKGVIPVDLPESKVAAKQDNKKNLTISIKQNGEISFDTTVVLIENIETKLCDYEADIPIYINCDKNAKFDHFVVLIDILKQKNFTNLGIITKKD
ncbi:MAG: TonB system transport protein ExbD [Sulfurimonas sp. RIFOXYD12_FULL_36_11]|jgi:biopolymer transport protein ExbD|uniref:ExbD/TolR family protein n=1 Tax=Sulfurimonas sp. RIFOXYB12_FULL_35_9 TaxID=1802256 RepID=UPI0008AB0D74|nr:biopolymer transporter ExbD [Sulfurimonas sp. RIFOXYB12_FULL_35_9]OHE04289.1 MAG: TonB system transport protein ExbD [Sulfurimonas sp. RIFOXYB12_FULL_35_9]OHE12514.1 MAG: TonB system transport protein ExbD [Sulfurimonas sp. RIFOXYD12_FULL_36_11]OHE15568.1 MAG: TonB system transport protein ExbD [Sulfurimonas sp. RIFOXYB2_FULL_37_5]